MNKTILFISLVSMLLLSCGDYAAIEQEEDNKRTADSLFRAHKDSLSKDLTVFCDSIYDLEYDKAYDSIRDIQLEKIIELTQ